MKVSASFRFVYVSLMFSVIVFISACNINYRVPSRYSTACPADIPILETVTINWGVAPGVVSFATPRILAIAQEVEKIRGVGIACFQELWTEESKKAIIKALGPDMHTYYVETRGENQRNGIDVCAPSEVGGVSSCAKKHCDTLPIEEQTICVLENCSSGLIKLYLTGGRECLNCLTASVGHSIDEILDICVQPANNSTIAGASRARLNS